MVALTSLEAHRFQIEKAKGNSMLVYKKPNRDLR